MSSFKVVDSNLSDKLESIGEKIFAMVELAESEGRDFSSSEKKLVDQWESERNSIQAEIEKKSNRIQNQLSGKLDNLLSENGFSQTGNQSSATVAKNTRGEAIHVLNKADKVAALSKTSVPHGVGEVIRARICGINDHTPQPIRAAMTGGNDLTGGILVPNDLSGQLIDIARAKSVLMNAGVQTIVLRSGSENTIARVVSQVTPEIKSEMSLFTAQDINLGGISLVPRTVGVYLECSRELAEDAPNFVQMIENQIASTLAVSIDKYGIQGFGGTSVGLTGSTAITETGSIGAIQWSDLSSAVTSIRVANHEPNAFVMYPTIHDALLNSVTGDGTNAAKGWLEAPPSIRDKSYYNTTNCPLGNVIVGDFSKYAFGLRTGVQIETSATAGNLMKQHAIGIKVTIRCDYAILDASAFQRLAGVTAS
jgi:HK97 family phage major capsid protein